MSTSVTVGEIAEKLGVDREEAYGLAKFLCAAKIATPRGTRSNPTKRGRGENVYEIDSDAGKLVAAALKKLGS